MQQLDPGFDGVVRYGESKSWLSSRRAQSVTEILVRALSDARLATEESCPPYLSLPILRWRAERIERAARVFIHDLRATCGGRTSTALPYVPALDDALKEAA